MAKIALTAEQVKQIERLSGLGLTVEKIATFFSISKKTLERRLKDTPGAADALLKGRAVAEEEVTQTLYDMATSGKCPVATIFWLKCRARWKDETKDDPPEDTGKQVYNTEWGTGTAVDPTAEKK